MPDANPGMVDWHPMKHRSALFIAAFALAPLPCLAYGGFPQDATDGQLMWGLLRLFLRSLPFITLPWIAGSFLVERTTGPLRIGIVLALVVGVNGLLLPELSVMGSFGFPHLVVPILATGHFAFMGYFLVKCLLVWRRPPMPERPIPAAGGAPAAL